MYQTPNYCQQCPFRCPSLFFMTLTAYGDIVTQILYMGGLGYKHNNSVWMKLSLSKRCAKIGHLADTEPCVLNKRGVWGLTVFCHHQNSF